MVDIVCNDLKGHFKAIHIVLLRLLLLDMVPLMQILLKTNLVYVDFTLF